MNDDSKNGTNLDDERIEYESVRTNTNEKYDNDEGGVDKGTSTNAQNMLQT